MRALGFAVWLALPFVAAVFGTQFPAADFYALLERPDFAPPGWIFAPVWTALYLAMGIAAGLVWLQHGFARAGYALGLFLIQLVLNGAWTWIFFGLREPGWALAEILCLWIAIVLTTLAFWSKRPAAAALLLPYLAWVSFAVVLNAALWQLNR